LVSDRWGAHAKKVASQNVGKGWAKQKKGDRNRERISRSYPIGRGKGRKEIGYAEERDMLMAKKDKEMMPRASRTNDSQLGDSDIKRKKKKVPINGKKKKKKKKCGQNTRVWSIFRERKMAIH